MSSLVDLIRAGGAHAVQVAQATTAAESIMTEEEQQHLLLQSVDDAVAELRYLRNSLSDTCHEEASTKFTRLDDVLMPLLQVQRQIDMDVLGPYPSDPDAFDVLISDVQPEDLPGRISQALGTQYLEEMEVMPNPVRGIVFNTRAHHLRVLLTLPVSARGKNVAAHFIFDTGAPQTYVALSVLEALGLPEISLHSEVVKINGVKASLAVSDTATVAYDVGGRMVEKPCHFVGLNILGMDFLDRAGIKLEIDMGTNAVLLSSPSFP